MKADKPKKKCPVCGSTRFIKGPLGYVCQKCGFRNDINHKINNTMKLNE